MSLRNIDVTPVQVPHRDEYSETAGYIIKGKTKKLYLSPILINGRSGIEI